MQGVCAMVCVQGMYAGGVCRECVCASVHTQVCVRSMCAQGGVYTSVCRVCVCVQSGVRLSLSLVYSLELTFRKA